MLQNELKEGDIYRMKVNGRLTHVKLNKIRKIEPTFSRFCGNLVTRAAKRYDCTNLVTKRDIVVKSAGKFLSRVDPLR